MERKIGEIFEIGGEWYQAIDNKHGVMCSGCVFVNECNECIADRNIVGSCGCEADNKLIFKKLEKVGVPYHNSEKKLCQQYKCYINPLVTDEIVYVFADNRAVIEIKQNKEDMEEKKTNFMEAIDALCKRYNMSDGVRTDFMSELKEIIKDKEDKLKPFNIEAAKQGKTVYTRDGRKARIICFDSKSDDKRPIVALVEDNGKELLYEYTIEGKEHFSHISTTGTSDLMMLPEKKEGWVNVYMEETNNNERLIEQVIYKTRKDAFDNACPIGYKATVKIEWEE